jgi:hypothetical protein
VLVQFWDHQTFHDAIISDIFVLLYVHEKPDTTSFGLLRYTWKLYSERLMTLTGVYGFWKYVSNLERRETRRYLEMFYALKYRSLASAVPLSFD